MWEMLKIFLLRMTNFCCVFEIYTVTNSNHGKHGIFSFMFYGFFCFFCLLGGYRMMALNFYRVRDYSFALHIVVRAVNISLHYNESETHGLTSAA